MSASIQELIQIDPGRRGGKPCIRDLRITVQDVLDWLAAGMSQEDILADYPELTAQDILAVLSYAARRERGEISLRVAA